MTASSLDVDGARMSDPTKQFDLSHQFQKGVIYVVLGHFTSAVLQLCGFAIAVRFMTKEEFGVFVLLTVVANFLVMVADFGMTSAIVRFLSAGKHNREEIAGTSLGFSLLVSLVIFVSTYLLGNSILLIFNLTLIKNLLIFVALLFFFQYLFARLTTVLQGLHLYGRFALVQVAWAVSRCFLIWLLVVLFPMQLTGLILAVVASLMISCVLAYFCIPWFVIPTVDFNLVRKILEFGFPLQINNVLAFIYERTDIVILSSLLGSASVGAYEVGYKLPNQVRALFEAFRSVFFPHLSRYYGEDEQDEASSLLRNTLRIVSFVISGITLVAILYGEEIMIILFSWRYVTSAKVLAVLMVGIIFGLCNHLMGTALIASGRPRTVLLTCIPETLLNVSSNLLLIPSWGILGAAWASVISRTAVNPVYLLLMGKRSFVKIGWTYLKSTICLGAAAFVFMSFKLSGVKGKGLVVVIFVLVSFFMRVVLFSDIKYLYEMLCSKRVGK